MKALGRRRSIVIDSLSWIKSPAAGSCFDVLMRQNPEKAGPVIMVVEADSAVRESLKFSLEVEGFKVRAYETAEQLLGENDLPETGVLIVHYHLPSMNGLNLILEMRRRSSIPALLVTGRASKAIRKGASDAGVSVVVKPFLGAELIDRIRKLLVSAQKG